nr:hypothetical protein CFP56_16599 [Quercus suber]
MSGKDNCYGVVSMEPGSTLRMRANTCIVSSITRGLTTAGGVPSRHSDVSGVKKGSTKLNSAFKLVKRNL